MLRVFVLSLLLLLVYGAVFGQEINPAQARTEVLSLIEAATPTNFRHLHVRTESHAPAAIDFSTIGERSLENIKSAISDPANHVEKSSFQEVYYWRGNNGERRTELSPRIGEKISNGTTKQVALGLGTVSFSTGDGKLHSRAENIIVVGKATQDIKKGDIVQMGRFGESEMADETASRKLNKMYFPHLIFSTRGIPFSEYFGKELSGVETVEKQEDESTIHYKFTITNKNKQKIDFDLVFTKLEDKAYPLYYTISNDGVVTERQDWTYQQIGNSYFPSQSVLEIEGISDPSKSTIETVTYSFSEEALDDNLYTSMTPVTADSERAFKEGKNIMARFMTRDGRVQLTGREVDFEVREKSQAAQ